CPDLCRQQNEQACHRGPSADYHYAEIKPRKFKRASPECHHSGAEEEAGINPEQPALHRTAAPDCNHNEYVAGSNCQKRTKPVFPGFQAALRSYRARITAEKQLRRAAFRCHSNALKTAVLFRSEFAAPL